MSSNWNPLLNWNPFFSISNFFSISKSPVQKADEILESWVKGPEGVGCADAKRAFAEDKSPPCETIEDLNSSLRDGRITEKEAFKLEFDDEYFPPAFRARLKERLPFYVDRRMDWLATNILDANYFKQNERIEMIDAMGALAAVAPNNPNATLRLENLTVIPPDLKTRDAEGLYNAFSLKEHALGALAMFAPHNEDAFNFLTAYILNSGNDFFSKVTVMHRMGEQGCDNPRVTGFFAKILENGNIVNGNGHFLHSAAIDVLILNSHERIADTLIHLARTSSCNGCRLHAIFSLGGLASADGGNEKARNFLIEVATGDYPGDMHIEAIDTLRHLAPANDAAFDALLNIHHSPKGCAKKSPTRPLEHKGKKEGCSCTGEDC